MPPAKYCAPRIIRWRHTDFWPAGLWRGRPTIRFEDSQWAAYLRWLAGY